MPLDFYPNNNDRNNNSANSLSANQPIKFYGLYLELLIAFIRLIVFKKKWHKILQQIFK